MTTNINSEVIMPSESRNWFVAMLSRIFHRTKNNPKINSHHTVEQKKIILEGALNSLIPLSESTINVVAQKNKVTEQWQHNRSNKETASEFELADVPATSPEVVKILTEAKIAFESTKQGTQSIHADQGQQNTASRIDVTNDKPINNDVASQSGTLINAELMQYKGKEIISIVHEEASVLNNDQLVLNLADDQLAKAKLESCVAESKTEDDEMAQTKSITEMNETEVHDYAKERVAESPLKKTLAGIKFPKRKVTKVEQVEKDKEV